MASITAPVRTAFAGKSPILLPVPYFSQRDSVTGQGDRMCFSSTCAMAAQFLKPGCLAGAGQPDDRHLAVVQRFGDTTNLQAQATALERLGIQAFDLDTDGTLTVAAMDKGSYKGKTFSITANPNALSRPHEANIQLVESDTETLLRELLGKKTVDDSQV
jgi:hypothetical protein